MSGDVVRVRLAASTRVHGGAQYAAGEVAAFPADIAEQLIARGAAERVPGPAQEEKAPTGPPRDTMVRFGRRKGAA